MAILNELLSFNEVIRFPEYSSAQNAFAGAPRKIRLEAGTLLVRVITTEKKDRTSGLITRPGTNLLSAAWWQRELGFGAIIAALEAHGGNATELLRASLAVPEIFSKSLDGWVKIELTAPAFCWSGIAAAQLDPINHMWYPGGGEQIFLPFLTSTRDSTSSAYARIAQFSWFHHFQEAAGAH